MPKRVSQMRTKSSRVNAEMPSASGSGPAKHDTDQLGLFLRLKPRRAPIAPAIVKAVEAVRIIADHPVPQGLAVHAGGFRGLFPAHA